MTWQPMRRLPKSAHPLTDGSLVGRYPEGTYPDEVWTNDLYEVSVIREFGPSAPGGWVTDYLTIKRMPDKSAIHDWRHFQMIKNDICGFEREGFELYPAESRLVDEANQYHLFVAPAGMTLPVGMFGPRNVNDDLPDARPAPGQGRQREFEPGTRVPKSKRREARKRGS